ncbi:hypothetical protein ACVW1C_005686 [Bradyrhizobium sp. USDA 4011]|jgi:hypothetical protein
MASRTEKTERLQVMLGLKTHGFLAVLSEKGTHGTSPTDVAKALIEDGIRRAIQEEWLSPDDVRKVQRPG